MCFPWPKFPSPKKYKMWDIVEASSTPSPPPKPLLCKDWILVPVKPSKRYLKHWPKSTTDDSQISSSTTFHWLCLNYRSIKVNNRGKKLISDKWIYKSTCPIGWVQFAKKKCSFLLRSEFPSILDLIKLAWVLRSLFSSPDVHMTSGGTVYVSS